MSDNYIGLILGLLMSLFLLAAILFPERF